MLSRSRSVGVVMIEVNVSKSGYTVKGHADEAVVCSAVSAVTQTTYLGLESCVDVHLEQDTGLLSVHLYNSSDVAEILLESMIEGLKRIERLYPNQLNITEADSSEED